MRLLVIRPQPGADATCARIQAAGDEAFLLPLFEVQPVAWEVPSPDQYDALLLTSGNAVRAAGSGLDGLRKLPIFVVGSASASAANNVGLTPTGVGDSGVDKALVMARSAGHRRLLWLAGEDRIAVSAPAEMTLDIRTVYRSAVLSPPQGFADHVRSADYILLHSPRAAGHFASLCDSHIIDRAALSLGTYSSNIAESAGSGWRAIITAPSPNDASLLAHLRSCFTNNATGP